MIKLDFSLAVTILLLIPLVLVFGLWIFYNFYRKQDWDLETAYFHQCPYCTFIFFDYQSKAVKSCPRCHSLVV